MAKKGKKAPANVGEPAPIFRDLQPIYDAWHDLSVSRQSGMSPVGLPWAELSAYCADNGIVGRQRLRWIRLLRAMDAVFLVEQSKSAEERREKRRASSGKPGSRD